MVHQSFEQSLLYTSDEVTKFNNLVHFARTRSRVVDALTHRYCEDNQECGDFQPPAGSSSFDIKALEDTITHPWATMWSEMFNIATRAGSICSLVVAIYVVVGTAYKLFRVCDYVRHRQVNPSDAVRLVFAPGTALARAILDQPSGHGPSAPDHLEMRAPRARPNAYAAPPLYPDIRTVDQDSHLGDNPMVEHDHLFGDRVVAKGAS